MSLAVENVAECGNELEAYYFRDENVEDGNVDIASITSESVEDIPNIIDRFFTRYYYIKHEATDVPYQVLFHTNRICLICLPPQHPIFTEGITELTFDVGNIDRSKNTVKGKGKKGGMILQSDSTLALLTSAQGKTYKVPSCISGKLVEVNAELSQLPQRLISASEGEAYLAIILPKPDQCEAIKSSLMSEKQYADYLANIENKTK